jgi:hypothetical protein
MGSTDFVYQFGVKGVQRILQVEEERDFVKIKN